MLIKYDVFELIIMIKFYQMFNKIIIFNKYYIFKARQDKNKNMLF